MILSYELPRNGQSFKAESEWVVSRVWEGATDGAADEASFRSDEELYPVIILYYCNIQ